MALSQFFGVVTFLSLFCLGNLYFESRLTAGDHCFCKVSTARKRNLYTRRQALIIKGSIHTYIYILKCSLGNMTTERQRFSGVAFDTCPEARNQGAVICNRLCPICLLTRSTLKGHIAQFSSTCQNPVVAQERQKVDCTGRSVGKFACVSATVFCQIITVL
jgi:hypothetical protein